MTVEFTIKYNYLAQKTIKKFMEPQHQTFKEAYRG